MKIKFQLLVISILFINVSFGQNLDFTNLIEKVSQQRMLCEQITKNYLMIGSKINVDQAKIEFDESKSAFSENLNLIANNLKGEVSKNALNNVMLLWNDLQLTINLVPTKISAIEILKKTNNLALACKDLSSKIFVENNFKNSNLFNVFIKQKLNSQKIAKAIKEVTGCPRVGTIVAGFEVSHFHLHLVPAWSIPDLDFKRATKRSEVEMKEIQQKIIECLKF